MLAIRAKRYPRVRGTRAAMLVRCCSTPVVYRRREALIEPVFGHTKLNRCIDRLQRRALAACRSEWRLIAATDNLIKPHRHHLAALAA